MTTSVEVCGGPILIVAGRQLPALSIAWKASEYPDRWTGHTVFMGECRLDVDHDEWPESQPVCMHCVVRDGDEQLGRGLDLAKVHGQVDFDLDKGEWYVPPPHLHASTC